LDLAKDDTSNGKSGRKLRDDATTSKLASEIIEKYWSGVD
jgi:hypothetical protein